MSTKKVYISPQKQGFQIPSVNQELVNSLVCTTWLLKGEKKHVQKRYKVPGDQRETSQSLNDLSTSIAFQQQ